MEVRSHSTPQFFHDDDDDGPGFDDGTVGDLAGTADPEGTRPTCELTQGRTRRVRPEFIKYTKRAKRVDVRKLKENIWKGLKIPTPDEQQPANSETMVRDSPEKKNSHMRIFPHTHYYFFGRTLTETHRRWVSQIPRKRARSMK